MRKKGCYHKNRPFRLLVAAALRFVQSYLNDIDSMGSISFRQDGKEGAAGGASETTTTERILAGKASYPLCSFLPFQTAN